MISILITLAIGAYKYISFPDHTFLVEWSRVLDVRLSEWCCSITMVWVQIPSREEQKKTKKTKNKKFDSSKI